MSRENVEVVRRGLEAWQRDNLDGWLSTCDPAIGWHTALERLIGGIESSYRGIDGLRRFTDAVVDALAASVAVLNPQMAFYERFGSRGVAVLEEAVARAREAGALVLLDAKRGDIGSTMDAYADYLRPGHPLAVDAMTVSPFLGPGSLQPAVDTARQFGGGLFVLARTSNPDAGTLQHAVVGERSAAH